MTFIIVHSSLYCNENEVSNVYKRKIVYEREIKLKEFNFKLLHGILPCNGNLYRWKIKTSDNCDICGEKQSIEHLLYKCRYVQPLWKEFECLFKVQISFTTVLGIDSNCQYDFLITLLSYLIYKEWLILSLENLPRKQRIVFHFYKNELDLRWKIYKKCSSFNESYLTDLQSFIEHLCTLLS